MVSRVKKVVRRFITGGKGSVPQTFDECLGRLRHIAPAINCVIDVGANRGNFLKAAAAVFEPKKLIAFEPNRELHKLINQNCPEAELFDFALGSSPGPGTIYKHPNPGMTSLLPIDDEVWKSIGWDPMDKIEASPVQIRMLSEFIDDRQVAEQETLLKIDTQGTELDIIRSAGRKVQAVHTIIMEYMFWSGYVGKPSFAEVIRCLDDRDFQLAMVVDMRFRRNGSPAVADFVFVRSAVKDTGWPRAAQQRVGVDNEMQ